ncbi:tryptophan halogenase family protein [Lentisalinibacter sediminis]|uniref:tryptophan halogenase family protein n=1 Tax=Lentisalinibacter sediminis TaxID=2992237 RepID=UPI00386FF1B8
MMPPRRVVIVGGGSAGWMAAAYLDAALNQPDLKVAEISLLESPDVPRIGVGEATIPSIHHVLATIGIDEIEFLKRVDGTFKHAIKYVNWMHGEDAYYHAFGRRRFKPLDYSASAWLKSDRSIPFSETVSAQPSLCESFVGPRALTDAPTDLRFTYAFHMNALKFADYLCEIATGRGVRHYLDHLTDVEMTPEGDIAAVRTRSGLRLEGDLFIDCTGFAALLIGRQLGVEWVDCSQWLLCDRALTLQVPYERNYPGYVRPNTLATAASAGWIWEIPLQNRRAWGYVHSAAFIDEDEAERELRAFVGSFADDLPARAVPFRTGYRAKSWVRNCVAIGLSAGFIEPLESTGLYLSDLATVMLSEHFPYHGDMAPLAFRYNRIIADRFLEILDFINLHYCLTHRRDTEFWREVRRPERIHDRLKAKLDYWRRKPPSMPDFEDASFPGEPAEPLPSGGLPGDHRPPVDTAGVFGLSSYEAILYGMDFLRAECDHWYGTTRPRARVLKPVAQRIAKAKATLPSHEEWLQRVCGMPDYPPTL